MVPPVSTNTAKQTNKNNQWSFHVTESFTHGSCRDRARRTEWLLLGKSRKLRVTEDLSSAASKCLKTRNKPTPKAFMKNGNVVNGSFGILPLESKYAE